MDFVQIDVTRRKFFLHVNGDSNKIIFIDMRSKKMEDDFRLKKSDAITATCLLERSIYVDLSTSMSSVANTKIIKTCPRE